MDWSSVSFFGQALVYRLFVPRILFCLEESAQVGPTYNSVSWTYAKDGLVDLDGLTETHCEAPSPRHNAKRNLLS